MKELKELAIPIQEWLIKNYDTMCSIVITDGHCYVVRKEHHLILPIDN